mmetsp:Transcript_29194/g.72207  ORF Transcript_29194/g.72207 Transcript_29194/m.72207 type:complete len:325 (+) Transcript_29194:293-1267(+)|eukprot:CAMPEP_0197575006 /NCGR_PEP_ID=MMETSP1326-20131121/557_1 /TAXON_ID=1155430 /ORGANISM="Genus nov. species nov., Strain RCC2288" /LENGTH=324 /DNA_ID=CAMNT_0043137699 /DNA_START=291 /DNA_END=1265 /DNA_ORIENTATION=+
MSATMEENSGFRLLQAQRARKAAEEDAQRLAVRVAQLQKEKDKSEKRITETRKRATVIHAYRRRNEESKQFKEALVKEREAEVSAQAKVLQETKAEASKRREESIKALEEAKREISRRAKEEREANERYLDEQKILDRKAAMEAKDEVKRQQTEQQQRLAMMKQKQMESTRDNYEQRLQREYEAQQEKEKDLQRMSKLELDLIEQLQQKQEEQKRAYEELETALLGGGGGTAKLGKSTKGGGVTAGGKSKGGAATEPGEEDVQKAFAAIDTEGTGTIPTEHLSDLMGALGITLDATQLKEAAEQLDAGKNGKVSYGEFVMWWNG